VSGPRTSGIWFSFVTRPAENALGPSPAAPSIFKSCVGAGATGFCSGGALVLISCCLGGSGRFSYFGGGGGGGGGAVGISEIFGGLRAALDLPAKAL
jgi:hypothetical protein